MTRRAYALIAAVILVSLAPAAGATTTWEFTGLVRTLGGATGPFPPELQALGIDEGAFVSGFLELDPSVPDSAAAVDQGTYYSGAVYMEVSVGDVSVWGEYGVVAVNLDREYQGDTYSRQLFWMTPAHLEPGGVVVAQIALELVDDGADLFVTDAFPLVPPDLAALEPFRAEPIPQTTSIAIQSPGGYGLIRAELTSLAAVPSVPEPSTLWLIGAGLLVATLRAPFEKARSR